MIYTTIAKSYVKRTYRPSLGFTQQTPVQVFLDPAWDRSVPIWPGMVAMKTRGNNVTLINAVGEPYGFFADYIGGDGIDRLLSQGINSTACWVLADDAESVILAPAFDTTQTWTDPANGTIAKVYAQTTGATRGKLVPSGTTGASTKPIARLVSVDSASQITIAGLRAGDA